LIDLMLGNCIDILPTLGKVNAIVTDPPYGMNWDTDCTRFTAGPRSHQGTTQGRKWGAEIGGDNRPFDPSPWLEFPKVILWGSNHFGSRLPVGTTLVWVKRNEPAYGTFLSDAEIAWMKGGCGIYLHKDLSMYSIAKSRVHPSQKPVGLMRWCIQRLKLNPGATILDPYMGSGSTGVAAVELGFDFIGIESDPVHFAVAERRLRSAMLPLFGAT
jgi:site-specific DNA-methyltransferase (adenine-specific)